MILTNGAVDDPWAPLDAYDDRSWIENGLFRNTKQFASLIRWFPEKTAAGVRAHLFFVMLIQAVSTAYRLWDRAQSPSGQPTTPEHLARRTPRNLRSRDPRPRPPKTYQMPALGAGHALLEGVGLERWRRQLKMENRDKVIVFVDDLYGIFEANELGVLSGLRMRKLPPHLGSPEDILRRYHCLPPEDANDLEDPPQGGEF